MTKTMILPIIALIALVLKSLFGFEIGSVVQDAIADATLAIITAWGVYVDHKKKPPLN
jgi:hypothetical protein